jgi:hypothetical protein
MMVESVFKVREGARDMLRVVNANCRRDTFAMIVDVIMKDLVEVTVVYMVAVTLLVVWFEKSGIGGWLDGPRVAFPGMGSIVGDLSPAGAGIKELMVAFPTTYDIANEVIAFVVGREDIAEELVLVVFVVVDGTDAIVLLVLVERFPTTRLELLEMTVVREMTKYLSVVALLAPSLTGNRPMMVVGMMVV